MLCRQTRNADEEDQGRRVPSDVLFSAKEETQYYKLKISAEPPLYGEVFKTYKKKPARWPTTTYQGNKYGTMADSQIYINPPPTHHHLHHHDHTTTTSMNTLPSFSTSTSTYTSTIACHHHLDLHLDLLLHQHCTP